MAHDVLMPQLGMAQDTAVLLSWTKTVGDPVTVGDVLMEVETDKTTVEVEAAYNGFIVDIRIPAGSHVPVGDVVAVISENADDVVAVAEPEIPPAVTKVSAQEIQQVATPTPISVKAPVPGKTLAGKILASPKAKIEARRRNIELTSLVKAGIPQPIHFADVSSIEIESAPVVLPPNFPVTTASGVIFVKVKREPLEEFLNWIHKEREDLRREFILMSIVTRALRSCVAVEHNEDVQCEYWSPRNFEESLTVINADKTALSLVQPVNTDAEAQVVIFDLQGSPITRYVPASHLEQLTLVMTSSRKNFKITCNYTSDIMSSGQAIRFASEFTNLLTHPISILV